MGYEVINSFGWVSLIFDFNHRYDANGNILGDGKRNFEYSSFDKVERITNNDGSASSVMHYGVDRQMYYKDDCFTTRGGTVRTQTTYLGSFEKVERSNSSGEPDTNFTEYKYYVGNDIVITQRDGKDDTTHYLHKDNLGSVVAVSNQAGEIVTQAIYDPWGKRSEIYTETALAALQVAAVTDRGFTGHKHIEALDIIHMKGRIYDSTLGRFMQADPHIQAPLNLQNHNRYSYVLNNPMSYTDPSGYFFKKLLKKTMQATGSWYVHKFLNKVGLSGIVSTVLNFIPYCYGWCSAVFNAQATFVATGSLGASIRAGAITYASSWATGQVGATYGAGTFENVLGNAIVGGVTSSLSGGKFGHGFIAAGVAAGLKGEKGDFGLGTEANMKPARVLTAAVVGGTASVIGGGKFANGAVTGAFTQLFNAESIIKRVNKALKASGLEQNKYAKRYLGLLKTLNDMANKAQQYDDHV